MSKNEKMKKNEKSEKMKQNDKSEKMKQLEDKLKGVMKREAAQQAENGSCEDYWWTPVCLRLCAPLSGLPFDLNFTLDSVTCNYDGHCNTPIVEFEGGNICITVPGYVEYTVTINDDLSIDCQYQAFYPLNY